MVKLPTIAPRSTTSKPTALGDEMAQSQTDLATGFESQICSRCGGCGRYSFNQMDRDMCYGCRGCGLVFTKRGSVARQYFQDSILTAAGDVKAGWIARDRKSTRLNSS